MLLVTLITVVLAFHSPGQLNNFATCSSESNFNHLVIDIYGGLTKPTKKQLKHLTVVESSCLIPDAKKREHLKLKRAINDWKARQANPMNYLIVQHGWSQDQAYYEWKVLKKESSSTPNHVNLTAYNPDGCYGSGQLEGNSAEDAYSQYDGNYDTLVGQEIGDLNYDAERYGTPEKAWEHEEEFNWY